ncbi:DUF2950 domain-containing protein [Reyranella sp.]|uniref:DUF2950 domain-containing protein n=1 Tax=Reyranella sp. TaxID=1929291 RepID=UPI003BAA2980
MSGAMFRRGLAALALVVGLAAVAVAQTPAPAAKTQGFATPDAAAQALTEAVRKNDRKAMDALLGTAWHDFVPGSDDDVQRRRAAYLAAWDDAHKLVMSGDDKARLEVGKAGWTLPIPLAKDGGEWRFDVAAGLKEMVLRRIGHDEAAVVQTLLAIVDAQGDYALIDPMNTGAPAYARRLLSSPGRKDGLYWPAKPGEPQSPLGPAVARAQADGQAPDGHYGYYFRLLYSQGAAAPGGARDYLVNGRMIGGFGVIAWPVRYGDTGVMTFIVNQDGVVYQQDLGPQTAQKAGAISSFDPGKGWTKADMTPP